MPGSPPRGPVCHLGKDAIFMSRVRGGRLGRVGRGPKRVWVAVLASLTILGGVAGFWVNAVYAELAGPSQEDRHITMAVTNYMRDGHITRHDLNDEIAERLMENFLKTLDTQKVFF